MLDFAMSENQLADDLMFQRALSIAQVMGIDAASFDVSCLAFERWNKGESLPRKVIRRHIYSVLLTHFKEKTCQI